MNPTIVRSSQGVTLVGGGPASSRDLRMALARAPLPVGADGGARHLLRAGVLPDAVIGDLDSLDPASRAAIPAERVHRLPDQSTTDFDKALRSIAAPFVLGVGFTGARLDHSLAALNALVRHAGRRCILIGPGDIAFAAPPELHLQLGEGDTLSLFPLAPVRGQSLGLDWPIDGLSFAPDGFIGTSNRVGRRQVRLRFDRPGMIVTLPRRRLGAAISGLTAAAMPDAADAPDARGG